MVNKTTQEDKYFMAIGATLRDAELGTNQGLLALRAARSVKRARREQRLTARMTPSGASGCQQALRTIAGSVGVSVGQALKALQVRSGRDIRQSATRGAGVNAVPEVFRSRGTCSSST